MANIKLSQLPLGSAIQGSEFFPIVQDGATKRIDIQAAVQAILNKGENVLKGTDAPGASTAAVYVGQGYVDTANDIYYVCTGIDGTSYEWIKIANDADLKELEEKLTEVIEQIDFTPYAKKAENETISGVWNFSNGATTKANTDEDAEGTIATVGYVKAKSAAAQEAGVAAANEAKEAAEAAQGTADTAVQNAAAAQLAAEGAQGTANTAVQKADAAQGTADEALANAATADGKAVAAQGTADTALANAATADGKAVAAQDAADAAQLAAEGAQDTADEAKESAATANEGVSAINKDLANYAKIKDVEDNYVTKTNADATYAKAADVVTKADAQTITGQKTFEADVLIPATTEDTAENAAVTKKYVVDSIADITIDETGLVHKAGEENIDGVKTFTNGIKTNSITATGSEFVIDSAVSEELTAVINGKVEANAVEAPEVKATTIKAVDENGLTLDSSVLNLGSENSVVTISGSKAVLADTLITPAEDGALTSKKYVDDEVAKKISSTEKGVANGVATLDENGLVPSSQLPSYVDDVEECADKATMDAKTGEAGKIYVTVDDGKTYRWSGSAYVEISSSLALGETSSTAFAGDKGKVAYDHALLTNGNPHNVALTDLGVTISAEAINALPGKTVNASKDTYGIVKVGNGIAVTDGVISVISAGEGDIDAKTSSEVVITPANLDYAVRSVLPATSTEAVSTLVAQTEYYIGEQATVSFAFPEVGELGQYCYVCFISGETAATLEISGSNYVGQLPTPVAGRTYEIFATWNGSKWAVQYISY